MSAPKKKIEKQFREVIASELKGDANKSKRKQLYQNFQGLFRPSLADKLCALVDHYGVSKRKLCDLKKLISIRNKIVHEGCYSPQSGDFEQLHDYVAHLRELVVRIILRILDYEGKYLSHLNGQEDVILLKRRVFRFPRTVFLATVCSSTLPTILGFHALQ